MANRASSSGSSASPSDVHLGPVGLEKPTKLVPPSQLATDRGRQGTDLRQDDLGPPIQRARIAPARLLQSGPRRTEAGELQGQAGHLGFRSVGHRDLLRHAPQLVPAPVERVERGLDQLPGLTELVRPGQASARRVLVCRQPAAPPALSRSVSERRATGQGGRPGRRRTGLVHRLPA